MSGVKQGGVKQHPLANCRGAVPLVALGRLRGAGACVHLGEVVGVGLRAQQEQQEQGDTRRSKSPPHHSDQRVQGWDRRTRSEVSEYCTVQAWQ